MQRPSAGYRGGIRVGHHYTHSHHIRDNDDDDDDNISLSNSDEKDDDNHHRDIKHSSIYPSMTTNSDFESAIRNLRPSATRQKKIKTNLNISKQKADLPQLNTTNDDNNNSLNEQKQDENNLQDKQSRRWFPKADVGHVDSNAFIRHNHVGKFNIVFVIKIE
jgi:hypothetical protein